MSATDLASMVPDEDWESDGEFEASLFEIEDAPTFKNKHLESNQTAKSFSDISVSKILTKNPNCSTPLRATHTSELNSRIGNGTASISSISQQSTPSLKHVHSHTPRNKPAYMRSIENRVETSVKPHRRKRKFPGPAGTLPKLVRGKCGDQACCIITL